MWLFIVLKYIIKNVTRDEAGCATRQRAVRLRACERCETRLERAETREDRELWRVRAQTR